MTSCADPGGMARKAPAQNVILFDPTTCPCKMIECPYYRDCGSCMEHHHGADSARETGCELYLAGRPVYGDHSFPSAKEERR